MTSQAEFGIRITADGTVAVTTAEKVKRSLGELGEVAGRASGAAGQANRHVEQSAKQAAFAMRQLPMQMTDIATGLASGQSPFMVLMQQGGQLKDVFGGIGPAARAVGGYVAGLINPLTLAAGAAAALGVAYYQGSREADAFRQTIILTGNAAGTTTERLAALSGSVAGSANTAKGAAADALAQLVATGKVGDEQLGRLATAALAMQRTTGRAVEDTVKQFALLGKAPVEASLKLNEQYNYLTAAVYRQIKALEDQGRTDEAAALAQETYAKAMLDRSKQIDENLGSFQKLWRGVATEASRAWDAMLGVGREQTFEERLKQLETAQGRGFFTAHRSQAEEQELAQLKQIQAEQTQLAHVQAERNKTEKAGVELSKEKDKYLSREAQKKRELARVEELYVASQKTAADAEARRQAIAGINEKYKPVKTDLDRMRELGRKNELDAYYETGGEETMRLVAEKREMESAKEAYKESIEAVRERVKAMGEAVTGEERYAETLKKENERLTEHIDTLGMTTEEVAAYKAQKLAAAQASAELTAHELDAAAALLEEQKVLPEVADGYRRLAAAKREAAGRLGEQAELTRRGASKEAAVETWREIERAGHDAFMHIGEKGVNAAERIGRALKQGVLEVLWQMTAKKWIVQIEKQFTGGGGGVGGGLSGLLGGLFGGGGDGLDNPLRNVQGGDFFWDLHTGGIVGQGGSALRQRDPAVFVGARRMHGGGVAGLAADEEPTVLKRGEGVFTPEQMRQLAPVGATAPSVSVIQHINIDSRTDQASIRTAMAIAKNEAVSAIMRSLREGGEFARATGVA